MPRFSAIERAAARRRATAGFTLVELLVSISIIGVITGMMMANFRGGQKSAEVRLASELVVNQIRSVQTSALSGRLASVCSGGSSDLSVCEPKNPAVACTGGVCQKRVPTGYGIRFTTSPASTFLLFYDTDGDWRYDAGEDVATVPYIASNAVQLTAASAGTPLDLVYAPPYGQVYVNGSSSGTPIVTLTLGHHFGATTRHVNVYTLSGKIEHD